MDRQGATWASITSAVEATARGLLGEDPKSGIELMFFSFCFVFLMRELWKDDGGVKTSRSSELTSRVPQLPEEKRHKLQCSNSEVLLWVFLEVASLHDYTSNTSARSRTKVALQRKRASMPEEVG